MNYKRERLTKTNAIPTIYISPKTNAEVDLVTNPTDWVEANQKRALPSSFQKSGKINIDESSFTCNTAEDPVGSPPATKRLKQDVPAVRILNGITGNSAEVSVQRFVKKLPTVNESQPKPKLVKVSGERYTIRKITNPSSTTGVKVMKQEIIQPITNEDLFEDVDLRSIDLPAAPVEAVTSTAVQQSSSQCAESFTEDLKPILMDSLKQIAEIKSMLNVKADAAPTTPKDSAETANISQSQFNKVQLFNGIKRYLSPSMNALLRIELFSTPGREYKKDEKIICQELLLLGDKTYSFLNDEWRLRLPAKVEVQKWLDEQATEEDDDAS